MKLPHFLSSLSSLSSLSRTNCKLRCCVCVSVSLSAFIGRQTNTHTQGFERRYARDKLNLIP
jgi:hypothetical protein